MNTIGRKIQRMREIKGLTQQQIADAIGLSKTQYGRIERDDSPISSERLEKIAEKMGVKPDDILQLNDSFTLIVGDVSNSYVSTANIIHLSVADSVSKNPQEKRLEALEKKLAKIEQMLQELSKS